MYKKILKPILFLFPPDFIHNTIAGSGKLIQKIRPIRWLLRKMWRRDDSRLGQTVLGIKFSNPIGLSAGFDKNVELTPLMDSIGFGFEVGGSLTLSEKRGNVRPWFYRLPKTESIMVHAGLANKGLVNIAGRLQRDQKKVRSTQLFLSVAVVAKTTKETNHDAIMDAKNTVLYILQRKLAKAVEINISCPNVGDDQPFTYPEVLDELLIELDKLDRAVPFLVKMPNLQDIGRFDKLLKVISRHNIQGVTVANLVPEQGAIDSMDDIPAGKIGGLSGSPTRDRSTQLIRHTYTQYRHRLVIVGVGGVFSGEDAYEKICAGASLVGLVTGLIFEGPQVVGQINSRLLELLSDDGFSNITEAVGSKLKKSR